MPVPTYLLTGVPLLGLLVGCSEDVGAYGFFFVMMVHVCVCVCVYMECYAYVDCTVYINKFLSVLISHAYTPFTL